MRSIVLVTVLGLATTALAGERRYALIHHGREREAWQVDQLKAVRGVIVDDLQSPRVVMVRAPSKRSIEPFARRHGWKIVGERAMRGMWQSVAEGAEALFRGPPRAAKRR